MHVYHVTERDTLLILYYVMNDQQELAVRVQTVTCYYLKILDLQQALQQLYSSGQQSYQATAAHEFLINFQKTPDAWSISHLLLQSAVYGEVSWHTH